MPAPRVGLLVEEAFVFLPKFGAYLKVTVKKGIGQRLLKCDAHADLSHAIEESKAVDLLLDQVDEWSDQVRIIVELKGGFPASQVLQKLASVAMGSRESKDSLDGLGQVAGQVFLGEIVRGAGSESSHGGFLTAESRHQDQRDGGEVGADLLNQLQPVHIGHDQVGEDEVGRLATNSLQCLEAATGEDQPKPAHGLQQARNHLVLELRIVNDEQRWSERVQTSPSNLESMRPDAGSSLSRTMATHQALRHCAYPTTHADRNSSRFQGVAIQRLRRSQRRRVEVRGFAAEPAPQIVGQGLTRGIASIGLLGHGLPANLRERSGNLGLDGPGGWRIFVDRVEEDVRRRAEEGGLATEKLVQDGSQAVLVAGWQNAGLSLPWHVRAQGTPECPEWCPAGPVPHRSPVGRRSRNPSGTQLPDGPDGHWQV